MHKGGRADGDRLNGSGHVGRWSTGYYVESEMTELISLLSAALTKGMKAALRKVTNTYRPIKKAFNFGKERR